MLACVTAFAAGRRCDLAALVTAKTRKTGFRFGGLTSLRDRRVTRCASDPDRFPSNNDDRMRGVERNGVELVSGEGPSGQMLRSRRAKFRGVLIGVAHSALLTRTKGGSARSAFMLAVAFTTILTVMPGARGEPGVTLRAALDRHPRSRRVTRCARRDALRLGREVDARMCR